MSDLGRNKSGMVEAGAEDSEVNIIIFFYFNTIKNYEDIIFVPSGFSWFVQNIEGHVMFCCH